MDSIKELIRNKLSIQDVVGSYITIIPFGKNYKACCPFHHEKTPSFHITPEKEMFYCFGCKKGGDIFSFIQEIEHVDFRESLKILAEKAGVSLHESAELSQELKVKKNLLLIHEYATRFYQLLLKNNEHVIQYLENRGINRDSIKHWRIGYIPDGFYQLITVLKQKKFSEKDLIESGLGIAGSRGAHDRFRGRVMFPISDSSGKVVGFSGRLFPGSDESAREGAGKYVNSPETVLYHKSKVLFGFHHAKQSMAEKKSAILVEGQFDCILLHQIGHTNTVAISGTAATQTHIEQLSRFAHEMIIATDNDSAGIQSAHKIAKLAYQFDCEVSLILLPTGKDPADIINENPELWKEYLGNKKDYLAFWSDTSIDQPLRDRLKLLQETIFPSFLGITNQVYRDDKLQRIATMLNVSIESIRSEFEKFLAVHEKEIVVENNSVIVGTKLTPLTIQSQELYLLHTYFPAETRDWFEKHPDAVSYIQSHTVSMDQSQIAYQLHQYASLDAQIWNIRLETIWMRLQQIIIEHEIDELKQKISQVRDLDLVESMQKQLLDLHVKRESLVHLLTE
jgi:DNA primase